MEFLSFDNGVIKNPYYRKEDEGGEPGHGTHRRWRRQHRDAINSMAPAYTQQLLPPNETPFRCKPATVCFDNYDVGTEHRITVAFTNTASVPKTFRVLPILPRFANVVKIEYLVPPRISPGLSWNVTIIYTPRVNTDISTAIYLKTDEGYFAVPLTSSKKSFVFSVEPSRVDFGTVTVGERKARRITLRNSGAMPGTVIVGGDFKSLLEQRHTNPVDGKQVSFFRISPQQYKVEIPSFSSSEIVVDFAPLNPMQIDSNISFTEKSNVQAVHIIPIAGCSTDLPVFLANGKLMFGACFYGQQYWDEVRVINRGNIPAVAEFQVVPSLANIVSVSPTRVCVQSGEEYGVKVFFSPTKDLPKDFAAAIKCVVQDQTLPLTLVIESVLSQRAPHLPTTSFDIGTVSLQLVNTVAVPVTNEANVNQLVGFEGLPSWITTIPEALILVPHETASFTLKIEVPQEGRFLQRFKLINEFGDAQFISVSGVGIHAPVTISARTLLLPMCNIGSSVSATTVLSNASEKPMHFSFLVPQHYFRVSPSSGVLLPGDSAVVAVIFDAPLEHEIAEYAQPIAPLARGPKTKKDTAVPIITETQSPPRRSMYAGWDSGNAEFLWSRHKQFKIQCRLNESDKDSSYILVRCCAVKAPVGIEEVEGELSIAHLRKQKNMEGDTRKASCKVVEVNDGETCSSSPVIKCEVFMDFGKIPIHHSYVRTCKIYNNGSVPCSVQPPAFDPFSAFSVLSVAFDDLPARTETEIPIAFNPRNYGNFSEVLKLELLFPDNTTASVCVKVQGTCTPTQLTILSAEAPPQDSTTPISLRHVTFECTRRSDSARKSVVLQNVGSFPLDVLITRMREAHEVANTGNVLCSFDAGDTLPFLMHPRIFTLQPNAKQVVDLVFAPSDAGVFMRRLRISASGEDRELLVEGRCVSRGIYSLLPIPDPRTGKPTAICFEGEAGCRPSLPLSLSFAEDESKTLIIGNVLKGSNIEFDVQNWELTRSLELRSEWRVVPLSQTVACGKEVRLSIQRVLLGEEGSDAGVSKHNSLFPFRFAIALKGEAVAALPYRVLYVVCTEQI